MVRAVLEHVAAAPDATRAVEALLDDLSAHERERVLSAHRTTVDRLLPPLSRAEADAVLETQYVECMGALAAIRGRSRLVTLAIDDTHEKTGSKYLNGGYSFTSVGQKIKWERSFKYPAVCDVTHQLFLGCVHRDRRLKEAEKRSMRPWLRDVIRKIHVVREAGSQVALVEADRFYFTAEFFASGYLGLLDPGAPARDQPRVIVPRKFTREKLKFKWNYLLDESAPQVFEETLKLSPYVTPALKRRCEGNFEPTSDACFLVPYACVALADEYAPGAPRTLGQLREEARHVHERISTLGREVTRAEGAYFAHYAKFSSKRPARPTSRRPRKRFHDAADARLYHECLRLGSRLAWWKREKTKLLKALTFFAVSVRPGEAPGDRPEYFLALARDYRDRWGIENGFRDVKQEFLRPVRSRKPTRRQLNLVLGMTLYNAWHVERARVALRRYRESAWNKVPWDPRRPHKRRRLEQEVSNLPTAKGYLIRAWTFGVLTLLKKRIERVLMNLS